MAFLQHALGASQLSELLRKRLHRDLTGVFCPPFLQRHHTELLAVRGIFLPHGCANLLQRPSQNASRQALGASGQMSHHLVESRAGSSTVVSLLVGSFSVSMTFVHLLSSSSFLYVTSRHAGDCFAGGT